MTIQSTKSEFEQRASFYSSGLWLWLSIGAALLAITGSVIGLLVPGIYASLTPAFLPQALAQDIANLATVSPA